MSEDSRRRLKHALEARDVESAITAARELRPLDPLDALEVLTLLAETRDRRFGAWAERWVARVVAERQLQPAAVESVRRLLRELPRQNEA
jgi:hypothetical protein